MRKLLFLLALLIPALSPAAGFDTAMEHYRNGSNGDAGANERANALLLELSAAEPANPLYLVYLGSTWSLRAREAWMPWNKIRHAERGLDTMAKAVALLGPEHEDLADRGMPVSLRVRSIAAASFVSVPGFFGRFDEGRELLSEVLADPRLESVSGPARAYVYFFAGQAAAEDGEREQATGLYRRTLELDPEGDYAARARAALAALE